VDRLADELWEGQPPDSSVAALRVQVSRLRKTLAAAGLDGLLVTKPTGYLLDLDDSAVDASLFERTTADARERLDAGDADGARELFRAALGLWRGAAFADVAGARFAELEAARLEECRVVAVEDCLEAELAAGRHRQVIGELEALVGAHPLRERLWSQLMLALHRSGRQADALAAYQSLRQRLAEDLGLEPSPELARLHQAILTHDVSLAPTPVAP
jgi:DNA-binding SARP family transcriptional activator